MTRSNSSTRRLSTCPTAPMVRGRRSWNKFTSFARIFIFPKHTMELQKRLDRGVPELEDFLKEFSSDYPPGTKPRGLAELDAAVRRGLAQCTGKTLRLPAVPWACHVPLILSGMYRDISLRCAGAHEGRSVESVPSTGGEAQCNGVRAAGKASSLRFLFARLSSDALVASDSRSGDSRAAGCSLAAT